MKAIILAGGRGTRLESVISDLPKPLAPIQGQPFTAILINFLVYHGVKELILSTGHMAEKFEDFLVAFKKLASQITLVRESSALGTGGATRSICDQLPKNESVLVLNGDTFFDFPLRTFINRFTGQNALVLRSINNSARYGTVQLQGDRVSAFLEKTGQDSPGLIYAGYSLLKVGDILEILPRGKSSLELDFFPKALKSLELKGQVTEGEFIDIGIPEDYHFANTQFPFSHYLGK